MKHFYLLLAMISTGCSEQPASPSLSVHLPCESPSDCGDPGLVCIKPSGGSGVCALGVVGCAAPACTSGMKCVAKLDAQCTGCTVDVGCLHVPPSCSAFLPGTCTVVVGGTNPAGDAGPKDGG